MLRLEPCSGGSANRIQTDACVSRVRVNIRVLRRPLVQSFRRGFESHGRKTYPGFQRAYEKSLLFNFYYLKNTFVRSKNQIPEYVN